MFTKTFARGMPVQGDWHGGECPAEPNDEVKVWFRSGRVTWALARQFIWYHDGRDSPNDIVRWEYA